MNKAIFLIMTIGMLFVQITQASDPKGDIVVNAKGFRNDKGEVRAALFVSAAGFPGKSEKAFRLAKAEIRNKRAELRFADIPFGAYAIALFHDENSDGELEKNWMGIPKEGYGTSRNAKGFMVPPKFDDARFELNAGRKNVSMIIRYRQNSSH